MNRLPRLFRPSPVLAYRVKDPSKPPRGRGRPRGDDPRQLNELANALLKTGDIFYGRSTTFGPFRRVNVVNERLCDDALNLLAPSLEAYKGCDILDIFPGAGLWSRKVHDFLKPRCHTLVDINQDGFDPFLRLLVEQPNSRYQYKTFDSNPKGANRRRTAYKDESVVNQFKANSAADAEWPLLVLSTCTAFPYNQIVDDSEGKTSKIDIAESIPLDSSPSEDFLFELMSQTSLLPEHQTRPLRLLMWTLDRDKFNIMPRSITGRKAAPFEVDESFAMQEIVGWSRSPRKAKGMTRAAQFDVKSAFSVARQMKQAGISLPEERRSPLHVEVLKELEANKQPGQMEHDLTLLDNTLIQATLQTLALEATGGSMKIQARKGRAALSNQMQALQYGFEAKLGDTTRTSSATRILAAYGEQVLLSELEKSIASQNATLPCIQPSATAPGGFVVELPPHTNTETPQPTTTLSHPTLSARIFPDVRPSLSPHIYASLAIADNHFALHRPTPLLAYDRRIHEPLESHPTDFFPQHHLSLLSLTKRDRPAQYRRQHERASHDPSSSKVRTAMSEKDKAAQERGNSTIARLPLVRRLIRAEATTLPAALDSVAHGAAEALLPVCKSINDPLLGGRLTVEVEGESDEASKIRNLHHLRVRMLTLEQWRELVDAWYAWPFRRSDMELEAEMGRSSIFTDFDAGRS